jgi:Ankyrin repeats (many copies)/Ankyrin repeat
LVDKSILKKLILSAIECNDVHQLKQLFAESPTDFGLAMKTHSFQTNFSYYVLQIAPETLGVLVQLGLDLNRHDNEGYAPDGTYPLGSCIHRRNLEMARLLLQNGADPNLCDALNTVSYMGEKATPADQIAMAQLLLDYGADINRVLPKLPGFTPLLRALEKGHTELAEFLISKGAVMPEFPDVEQARSLTWTPLKLGWKKFAWNIGTRFARSFPPRDSACLVWKPIAIL